MNKKVLSAILFGALFAGTGTFTSCIDNDEPAGIEELRGAKAELLRAKAAVEAAKVALIQAQAAAAQAQAELDKAKAAAEQAKSAAEVAKIQAEAEIAIAEAERIRKEAEAAYQKAILEIKKAQAELVGEQATAIQSFVTAYDAAYDKYNAAVDAQTAAQRELNNHLAVEEEKESKKELFTRDLTRNVALAEKNLEGLQEALAEAQEELAAAKELEPHAYAEKAEELENKRKQIVLEIADLQIEAAETIYGFYESGRVKEVQDLWQAHYDLLGEEQVIPAFNLEFGDGTGLPLWWDRAPFAYEELTYSMVEQDNYINVDASLEQLLGALKSLTRDENDNAWTKEAIVKMEGDLAAIEKRIEEYKKYWAEAVAAYQTGKYNDADETAISGYDELVAALAAFNAASTDWNAATEALIALDTKDADLKAMNDAIDKNQKDYAAAVKAAADAKDAALKTETLKATVDAKTKSLQAALEAAQKACKEASDAAEAYKADKNFDPNVYAGMLVLVQNAEKAMLDAAAAVSNYNEGVERTNIENAYTAAIAAAVKAQADGDAAARKAYNDKWDATNGTAVAAIEAAEATVAEKQKVVDEAREALEDACVVYNDNVWDSNTTPINVNDVYSAYRGVYNAEKGYRVKQTIKIEDLLVLNKEALKNSIRLRTWVLFGNSYENIYEDGVDVGRLVELTAEDVAKAIAEVEDLYTYSQYESLCYGYGMIGESVALAEKIRIAKSWLENGEQIEALIKTVEEAHDALHVAHEAYILSIEEAEAAAKEAFELLIADALATEEPVEAKIAELEPLADLYAAYVKAINAYRAQGEYVTEDDIINFVTECETIVSDLEGQIYDAETALMWAKENLEKWNEGGIRMTEILTFQLEQATIAVERAYEKLLAAQERLAQALAAVEWSAAE